MIYIFDGKHFAHIGASGRVAYHGRSAADKGNRLVSRHLKTFHKRQRHKMSCGKAVCGAVKADVELCFSAVYHAAYLCLIGNLSDKAARKQLVVNCHCRV